MNTEIVERAEQTEEPERGKEILKLDANVDIVLLGPDGEVKDERHVHNLVVTAGKEKLLSVASPAYIKGFAYMVIGTGTGAAAITDTYNTFTSPTYYTSNPVTPTNPDADHIQFQATWAAGSGTGAITEAGLLDAGTTGNLLCRQVFSVINKGSGDSLQITWQLNL